MQFQHERTRIPPGTAAGSYAPNPLAGTAWIAHRPETDAAPLGVLLVDDHAIVRDGLKRMLEASAGDWRVEEASDGFAALKRLRGGGFDVAIVDLSMPGMGGLELLRRAQAEFPALRMLMLSMHSEEQYALRAIKAGAHGYVTKDCAPRELVAAVRKVVSGGTYVSAGLAERMVQTLRGSNAPSGHDLLSDRELDILRRLAAGRRPTDIADDLHLSAKTVSTYRGRILERLGLPNTAAMIRYAMEHGMVDDSTPHRC